MQNQRQTQTVDDFISLLGMLLWINEITSYDLLTKVVGFVMLSPSLTNHRAFGMTQRKHIIIIITMRVQDRWIENRYLRMSGMLYLKYQT